MFQCHIADLNIEINEVYKGIRIMTRPFQCEFRTPDIVINSSQEIIDFEKSISEDKTRPAKSFYEKSAIFRLIADQLPKYDGVVLHSCFFKALDKGIAFGAFSGTGKTTHMMLWQELLGDKMSIINGDKPIIRFVDGKLYAYGTPWAGKEGLYENTKAPLTDICKIERSLTNKTEPMRKNEGISLLMQQIYIPTDPISRVQTIELIYKIADSVRFWKISCNMDISAAETAYNKIFEDKF